MRQETINTANKRLLRENTELRQRLAEAEEALRAIREGEVDAVIVSGEKGDRVFSLTETESLYRLMVESMNEAGMAVSPDGMIIYCNNRASAILKIPKEQLLGRNLRELVVPDDTARVEHLLHSALEQNAASRIRFIQKYGAPVPLHIWANRLEQPEGTVICMIGTDLSRIEAYQDLITQLGDQKNALHDSHIATLNLMDDAIDARRTAQREGSRLKAVMDALPVGVAIVDKLGGTVDSNPMFETIWTGPRPETRSFDDYGKYQAWWAETGKPVEPLEWASSLAARNGETVTGQMFRIKLFNGEEAHVINSAAPIYDADGNIDGCAVSIQDITRLWSAEQAITRSAERFKLLSMTAGDLLTAKEPRDIIESLCMKVMEHLDCQVFFNFIAYGDAGKLRLNAYSGISEEEALRIAWLENGAAASGSCNVDHISTAPDLHTGLLRSHGIKAYASHLLKSEDESLIGTLSFGTKSREIFSEDDLFLMKAIADQVTVALFRGQTEEALQESERRFRSLFDFMTDGILLLEMLYDAEGSPTDYLVLSANPAVERLIGIRSLDAIGMKASDLLGAARAPFLESLTSMLSTGKPVSFESYFTPMDKYFSISAFLISGTRFAVVIEDITDRYLAEEEMRQTLMATTDGIWKRNFNTGEVFFSPRYYTMLGYDPDEFPASLDSWKGLIHPDDFDQAMLVHTKFEEENEDNYANEFRMRAKDGSYRSIRSRGRVIKRDDNGRRLRIIGNHDDVTEEKAVVSMLEETSVLLTTIVDNTDLLIAYLDSYFNYIRVNRAYAAAGNKDISYFPGKNHFSLNPSADLMEHFREVVRSGIPFFQKGKSCIFTQNSEQGPNYWDLSIIPIKDNNGIVKSLILTLADVSDHMEQEAALSQFNEKLEKMVHERTKDLFLTNEILKEEINSRKIAEEEKERALADLDTIFNSMSIGMTVIDRNYRYIRVNRRFSEMVSIDESELLGKKCHDLWNNIICVSGTCPIKNIFSGTNEFPYEYEMRYMNPLGKELIFQFSIMPYYEKDNTIAGIISNVIDVTEKKEMLLKLTNIIDEERKNISYELHDDLGQNLTAIGFIIESIRQKIKNPPPGIIEKINEVSDILIMAQNKTRSLSKILSPVEIGREGLRASLEIMARSIERIFNIKCNLIVDDGFAIEDNNIATILYYIIREASTNAAKHGNSKTIFIHACRNDVSRGIIVKDDGTGIGKGTIDAGIGLKIMKYRAQIIGASFSAGNGINGGFEVAVRLPY